MICPGLTLDLLLFGYSQLGLFEKILFCNCSLNIHLLQLLRRNPERRLGAGERDAEEVKRHPFFRVSTVLLSLKFDITKPLSHTCYFSSEYGLGSPAGEKDPASVFADHQRA